MRAIMLFGLSLQKNSRLEYSEAASYDFIPEPAMKKINDNDNKE